MGNSPFISVVIPTYNRAGFIKLAIESLLKQTFQDFEIIVVDDGSTDNTSEVVAKIVSEKLHYYKKENAERAAARNFGARHATGFFITFLDSDDVVYPNHLEVARNFVARNKGVKAFHLGYDVKDLNGKELRTIDNIYDVNAKILSGNILSCNGVFLERKIMLENLFNEDRALSSLEDWELWLRISARYPFLNSNVITSSVIQHQERSVMTEDIEKIKQKVDRFIHYVINDEENRRRFKSSLKKPVASAWTYAALHLAIAEAGKGEILRNLLRGVSINPFEVFKRRTLVILRKLIYY